MKVAYVCTLIILLFIVPLYCWTQDNHSQFLQEWQNYKGKHKKEYSPDEDVRRMNIYKKRKEQIQTHNEDYEKGDTTFYLKENHLMDLEPHEMHMKPMSYDLQHLQHLQYTSTDDQNNLSKAVDWRNEGIISQVKNQGYCGSCWAFTTTGILESYYAKITGKHVSLSEQFLVDCGFKTGNEGCTGGNAYLGLQLVQAEGIPTERNYPYMDDANHNCLENVKKFDDFTINGLSGVAPSESALQIAVAKIGPMAVGIDASDEKFLHYGGGIYYNDYCSNVWLNHAVEVVGYGTDDEGNDYWIIKNSWGTNWGDNGFGKMIRNKDNNCGIATFIVYPVLASDGNWDGRDGASDIRSSFYLQTFISLIFFLVTFFR